MNLPELLGLYMTEKHMDDITLARKCNISPMNIVNIKKGSHTYSQQLVENIVRGLELNADEISQIVFFRYLFDITRSIPDNVPIGIDVFAAGYKLSQVTVCVAKN